MRFYLTLFLFALSSASVFGENSAEVFTKGFQFYTRGDYPAAIEMFKQISEKDAELFALASYYTGSIYAFEGKPEAFDMLKKSVEKAVDIKTRQMAFNQFARLCLANDNYKAIADFESLVEQKKFKYNTENAYYFAVAEYCLGNEKKSQSWIDTILKLGISNPDAIGVDMFILARLDGEKFAASYLAKDISVLKKGKKNLNATALARFEILENKQISQSQKDISFFAQILLAEEKPTAIDKKLFEEEIYKNRNAPFAWRGALALGKIYFSEKNYEKASLCAKDCIKLSSPEIMSSWRGIMLLADSLRMMKKYDDARSEYQKIFMNRKTRGEPIAEALYKTGVCFFEQGEWADAHVCFERVFVAFFRYEYWGSRAYYYDSQALYSLGERRDAKATLVEYFNRAKDKNSLIYKAAQKYYKEI